jgi:centromere/kinetochore protein ZW10
MTDRARGFVDTGDQDRYDECEAAVNEVLKNIKRLAPRFKVRFNSDPLYIQLLMDSII